MFTSPYVYCKCVISLTRINSKLFPVPSYQGVREQRHNTYWLSVPQFLTGYSCELYFFLFLCSGVSLFSLDSHELFCMFRKTIVLGLNYHKDNKVPRNICARVIDLYSSQSKTGVFIANEVNVTRPFDLDIKCKHT